MLEMRGQVLMPECDSMYNLVVSCRSFTGSYRAEVLKSDYVSRLVSIVFSIHITLLYCSKR